MRTRSRSAGAVVTALLVFALASCSSSSDEPRGAWVPTDGFDPDMLSRVTDAGPGEPSTKAGFIVGVQEASRRSSADGEITGVEIRFTDEADETTYQLIQEKADAAGYGSVVLLGEGDRWPYCPETGDCPPISK